MRDHTIYLNAETVTVKTNSKLSQLPLLLCSTGSNRKRTQDACAAAAKFQHTRDGSIWPEVINIFRSQLS